MQRSESIAKLAEALSKAQGEINHAAKDKQNDFFRSKYADLAAHREAIRSAFSRHGLAVSQFPTVQDKQVSIETLLCHASGEWLSEKLVLPLAKTDVQAIGSAITYGRRYGLSSICGTAPDDDDDGNAANQRNGHHEELAVDTQAAAKKIHNYCQVHLTDDLTIDDLNGKILAWIKAIPEKDVRLGVWEATKEHAARGGLIFDEEQKRFILDVQALAEKAD